MPMGRGHQGAVVFVLAIGMLACRTTPVTPEPDEGARSPEAPGWTRPILDAVDPPLDEPPPTGAVGMFAFAHDRVGPLYADMPVELRFLQTLFTDFEVRAAVELSERERRQRVYEIYDQETRLLVVEPEEYARPDRAEANGIDRVRVESPLFRSPEGFGVGDRFEVIARAHGPLECQAGERRGNGELVAICRSPADGGALRWIFPAPDEPMPPGWLSPSASAEFLAGAQVVEVWWQPSDD